MMRARQLIALAATLAAVHACARQPASAIIPDGIRYVPRAEWGASPPVLPMRRHVPVRLTIHHTGTRSAAGRTIESKLAGLQRFSQRQDSLADGRLKPAWPDVPYHFYVSVDGAVAEGREWQYVGDSNTPYDPTGHLLVVVEGNFEAEAVSVPQLRTLEALIPSLARHFRIAPDALASHRDYAQTLCPGRQLYAELPRFRRLIEEATR